MIRQEFDHVTTWVFDLDNTLYPPRMGLFDQIESKMTAWVMQHLSLPEAEADALRSRYYLQYGTTLAGLMTQHQMPPDAFLAHVHDVDFAPLLPDPILAAQIRALPGRRIIYTNATQPYAENVLQKRGLDGLFDAIYGIEHAGFRPKPEAAAFAEIFTRDGLDPKRAAMFEDDPRNLQVPHALGMRTIHIAPDPHRADHIHHHADELTDFLARLLA